MEIVAPFKEAEEEVREAGAVSTGLCYQCGKCDVVCPWNRVRKFSIRKIIREAVFGLTEIESEDIWRCTTCGTCQSNCPRGVKQIDISVAIRRVASQYGVFPTSVRSVSAARGSLTTEGNPLHDTRSRRADWAKGFSIKPYTEGMDILYFVGCYYSYDPRLKKVAIATSNILKKAGINFGILGTKENCCGESIRKSGGEEAFRNLAKENIKTFIDHGVKKILVSSPHCYYTFKNEYPEFMVNFDIIHISEYISNLIDSGRLKLRGDYSRKATYHDPCYLGRHSEVYDAPREVLKKIPGLELIEMTDSREGSLCCGGGGGRIWMDTPKNERFSDLRLEQARDVGAEVLVTSCPYCITNFEESRLSFEREDVLQIRDISEIVQAVIA